MKIIHCADLHIGVRGGKLIDGISSRVLDFIESVDLMIDFAYNENVDAVLIAGDIFHKNNPDKVLINLFAERLQRLAEQCPVVLLTGNHDANNPRHKKSAIDIYRTVKKRNVFVYNDFQTVELKTNNGILQVSTFPYPSKHIMKDYDNDVDCILVKLKNELKPGLPSIFLGHFTVSGSKYGSERPFVLGKAAEIDLMKFLGYSFLNSKIDCPWNYLALGHLHLHQVVNENPPVVYSGSIDRIDFGEELDDKGFVLVTIDNDKTEWEFINVDARPLITIEVDITNEPDAMRAIEDAILNTDIMYAIVRVIIYANNATRVNRHRIEQLLNDEIVHYIHSIVVKLPETSYVPRLKLDKPIQAYSKLELIGLYFESVGEDFTDDLQELAIDIMESDE